MAIERSLRPPAAAGLEDLELRDDASLLGQGWHRDRSRSVSAGLLIAGLGEHGTALQARREVPTPRSRQRKKRRANEHRREPGVYGLSRRVGCGIEHARGYRVAR